MKTRISDRFAIISDRFLLSVLPKTRGKLEGSGMPLHCVQQEGSVGVQGLHQALQRSPQPFSKSAPKLCGTSCIGLWRIGQAGGIVADAGQDDVTVVPKILWGLALSSGQQRSLKDSPRLKASHG